MSLVTTKDLMLDAQKNHYAIGAFNAENMEMVQAIIAAAEELRAPVIVQTTPGTLKYASPAMFHAMVAAAASEASVPVVMHLDHGSSYELAMQAFRAGYTSVMIDGSSHSFEDNIALTRKVVEYAHDHGVVVEGELGTLAGIEDEVSEDQLKEILSVDNSLWEDEAKGVEEFYAKFGDRLPKALSDELNTLKANLEK